MCKLRKELNRLSYELMDDIHNIVENPAIKSEKRAQRLIVDTWHASFNRAMANINDDYEKLVVYMFNNMITYQHVRLSMDDMISMISAVLSIMASVKDGDFNEKT